MTKGKSSMPAGTKNSTRAPPAALSSLAASSPVFAVSGSLAVGKGPAATLPPLDDLLIFLELETLLLCGDCARYHPCVIPSSLFPLPARTKRGLHWYYPQVEAGHCFLQSKGSPFGLTLPNLLRTTGGRQVCPQTIFQEGLHMSLAQTSQVSRISKYSAQGVPTLYVLEPFPLGV